MQSAKEVHYTLAELLKQFEVILHQLVQPHARIAGQVGTQSLLEVLLTLVAARQGIKIVQRGGYLFDGTLGYYVLDRMKHRLQN